jgi:hypothetical protein
MNLKWGNKELNSDLNRSDAVIAKFQVNMFKKDTNTLEKHTASISRAEVSTYKSTWHESQKRNLIVLTTTKTSNQTSLKNMNMHLFMFYMKIVLSSQKCTYRQ